MRVAHGIFYPLVGQWQGFSCTIVLFASVADPNTIFMIVMSRRSYFILGIFVENLVARFFEMNIYHYVHQKMNNALRIVVEGALASVIRIIDGKSWIVAESDKILTLIISLNYHGEFREIELKGTGYIGDHAQTVVIANRAITRFRQRRSKRMKFSSSHGG